MKNLIKASAALIATALFAGCNFAQPTAPCIVGHGGYGASYTYVSGDNAEDSPCFRESDIIGVQKYRQGGLDDPQTVYLKPESISSFTYLTEGPTGEAYTSLASGDLAGYEPEDGRCTVPTLTAASGPLLERVLAGDGTEVTYQFSNVAFVVEGSIAGTQFSADLTISREASGTGPACSTTYRVNAMYPVIFCNDHDAEGKLVAAASTADVEPADGVPDACQEADHFWSGYAANPAFNSQCQQYGNPGGNYDWLFANEEPDDPADYQAPVNWFICTPAADVPSLIDG